MAKKLHDDVVQSADFTRTATKDLVTGKITYSKWNPEKGHFDAVKAIAIAGYTPNPAQIDAMDVDPDTTQNSSVTITYTAQKSTIIVNFVDTQDNNNVVQTKTFTGVTGATLNLDQNSFKDIYPKMNNYNIDWSKLPKSDTYPAGSKTIQISLTHKLTPTITSENATQYGVKVEDLTRQITRTVEFMTN